ncbi:MAG: hypothetical protein QXL54_03250 [Candidatus Bathyarchaeia archaeon]
MKCKTCGKKVSCPEHGDAYVKEEFDLCGFAFYFCEKCLEECESAFGSIVHWHQAEAIETLYEVLEYLPR